MSAGSPDEDVSLRKRPLGELEADLARDHVLERRWRSPRGELALFRADADHATLVKIVPREPPGMAAVAYEVMSRCQVAAGESGCKSVMPVPVAWGSEPDYIAYRWVEGRLVSDLVTAMVEGRSAPDTPSVLDLARASGAALARFHRSMPVEGSPVPAHLGATQARKLISRASGEPRMAAVVVRSTRDPGPHNAVLDDRGEIIMIDPPALVTFVRPEEDLGVLAYHFGWRACGRRRSDLDVGRVTDEIVAGYREQSGPQDPLIERQGVEFVFAVMAVAGLRRRISRIWSRRPRAGHGRPSLIGRQAWWGLRAGARARNLGRST